MSEIINTIKLFDLIYIVITLLTIIQCWKRGFVLSVLTTLKWLLALILTIIIVPKLKPWASNYIDSDYIVNIVLGISVFFCAIFIILLVNRGISNIIKYSGLGRLDSIFGFFFGFIKSFIVCVILFSIVNWLHPYEKWPSRVENSITFPYIYKGSNYLIKEFLNNKKYRDSKKKIENI